MKFRKDLFYLLLLLVLSLIFWAQALGPGKVLFLRDISTEITAKRHFWVNAHGFALWFPYIFFGAPYAANSQSEAFYPLTFLYLVLGAERGSVYFVIIHHLLLILSSYPMFRVLGFRQESSLAGAIGFGFGGYMVSLTLQLLSLSTIAWMPLMVICLDRARLRSCWRWGLLLAPVLALQILAGEFQLAGMCWMLAFCAVMFGPRPLGSAGEFFKLCAAMLTGLVFGAVMSAPQLGLTLQMIPLSNRGEGREVANVFFWSLEPSALKSLLIPNYIPPLSAGEDWGLGFFSGYSYLFSFYSGAVLLLLSFFAFFTTGLKRAWLWLLLGAFGLIMMMGDNLPVYPLLYKYLPGLKMFRFPVKFFFLLNFSLVMLSLFGLEFISDRKWNLPVTGLGCLIAGALVAVLLIAFPVRFQDLGADHIRIANYLMLRSVFRIVALALLALGLALVAGRFKGHLAQLTIALLMFCDLYFAHRYLNPATGSEFFSTNKFIREMKEQNKSRLDPVRIFSILPPKQDLILQRVIAPVPFYGRVRDSLESIWAVYYDLDNIWAVGSFYPVDVSKFKNLLAEVKWPATEMILARAGAEFFYYRDQGFVGIPGALPRAMVFYNAGAVASQDEAIKIWQDSNFPVREILLLENDDQKIEKIPGLLMSHPAKIVKYENEKVVVEAAAKQDGWLVLLDSYYPGWKAELDGKPAQIYRADGFFRAVKIPAGAHTVSFSYFPDLFIKSLYVCGAGFLVWVMLLSLGLVAKSKRPVESIRKSR
jgi:hypothetical protein